MRGEIVLENGERAEFFLSPSDMRRLEHEVRLQNEFHRERGISAVFGMADELRHGIRKHLGTLPDPEKEESPGEATPRDSR